MLYSDWLKIRIQNQVNILPPKWIWGGGGEDVNLGLFFLPPPPPPPHSNVNFMV